MIKRVVYIIHNYSSRQFFATRIKILLAALKIHLERIEIRLCGKDRSREFKISKNRFSRIEEKLSRRVKTSGTSTKLAVWAGYILLSGVSRWVAGRGDFSSGVPAGSTRLGPSKLSHCHGTLQHFSFSLASSSTHAYMCVCFNIFMSTIFERSILRHRKNKRKNVVGMSKFRSKAY